MNRKTKNSNEPIVNLSRSQLKKLTGYSSSSNVINFDDHIYGDAVTDLIQSIEDVIANEYHLNDEQGIVIYFQSHGGTIDSMITLIDYICHKEEKFTIILNGDCSSAGCFIPMLLSKEDKFLSGNSTIEVLKFNKFLLHLSSTCLFDTRSDRDTRNERRDIEIDKKISKEIDDMLFALCSEAGLSDTDLELLLLGQDISYTSDEFQGILNAITEHNFETARINSMKEFLGESIENGSLDVQLLFDFVDETRKKINEMNESEVKESVALDFTEGLAKELLYTPQADTSNSCGNGCNCGTTKKPKKNKNKKQKDNV